MKVIFGLFLVFILLPSVSAIQTDTISITLPPDSRECFDILLPDNMGVSLPGRYEYNIMVYPDPEESWLDLTEITIRTDENEAVLVPVCFSSIGQPIGNCSEPFELSIKAIGPEAVPEKNITGRACVGINKDVDTGKDPATQTTGMDVFDMALEKDVLYTKPGEKIDYTVLLQSQAGVTVDLEVVSEGKSIINKTAEFGEESFSTATFSLKAAQGGEYRFIVTGKVRGCAKELCTKSVSGKLMVSEKPIKETGFSISLFPSSIDIKGTNPVDFRATTENNMGDEKTFLISLDLPEGLRSDFYQENVTVPSDEKETVIFTVTPEMGSQQFSLSVNATLDGTTKVATSYLSTDEMLTDTQNMAEHAGTEEAQSVVDDYVRRYIGSDYNETLDDYGETVGTLGEMIPEDEEPINDDDNGGITDDEEQPDGMPVWVYGIIVAVAVAAGLLFLKFKGNKQGLDEDFKLK